LSRFRVAGSSSIAASESYSQASGQRITIFQTSFKAARLLDWIQIARNAIVVKAALDSVNLAVIVRVRREIKVGTNKRRRGRA
jgi:hypothetical protein